MNSLDDLAFPLFFIKNAKTRHGKVFFMPGFAVNSDCRLVDGQVLRQFLLELLQFSCLLLQLMLGLHQLSCLFEKPVTKM
jgi:hypothetical protein